jgi:hypothetical protein
MPVTFGGYNKDELLLVGGEAIQSDKWKTRYVPTPRPREQLNWQSEYDNNNISLPEGRHHHHPPGRLSITERVHDIFIHLDYTVGHWLCNIQPATPWSISRYKMCVYTHYTVPCTVKEDVVWARLSVNLIFPISLLLLLLLLFALLVRNHSNVCLLYLFLYSPYNI